MIRRVLRILAVGIVALVACSAQPHTAPAPAPSGADLRDSIMRRDFGFIHDTLPILKFNPPLLYISIRSDVERCTGLKREGWPTFYVANINPLPGMVWAFYAEKKRYVVFALGMESAPPTIAHELGHYLLAPHIDSNPQAGETQEEWVTRTHPDSIYGPDGKCKHLFYPS